MAEWTDERMDDLAAQMAAGFDRTDREIGSLRLEIGALRTDVKRDIDGLRAELKSTNEALRTQIENSNGTLRAQLENSNEALRTEFKSDMGMLRTEIEGVRAMMFRFCTVLVLLMGGCMAALIGVLATAPA